MPVGLSVDKGEIRVGNLGLHYQNSTQNTPNFAQLFAQTANIHGQITGITNDFVQVIVDQNSIGLSPTVNATDTKPKIAKPSTTAPQMRINIGNLGQVYADGIQIVSTDKGVGVNVNGHLTASLYMTLQADGKIVNTGTLRTAHSNSVLSINGTGDGENIINTGNIHSKGQVLLASPHDIVNGEQAVILGDKNTQLYADNSIYFHQIDYTNTATNLDIYAKNTISSQNPTHIDTKGSVSLNAQSNYI